MLCLLWLLSACLFCLLACLPWLPPGRGSGPLCLLCVPCLLCMPCRVRVPCLLLCFCFVCFVYAVCFYSVYRDCPACPAPLDGYDRSGLSGLSGLLARLSACLHACVFGQFCLCWSPWPCLPCLSGLPCRSWAQSTLNLRAGSRARRTQTLPDFDAPEGLESGCPGLAARSVRYAPPLRTAAARTQPACFGAYIAAPLLVLFIAGLLVVAKDGLMITQPSILASTADNLWPNTAACCRAVRPSDTQLLLVLCATRLLVVVGDGLMMNQFSIFASTADSVGPSIARRHATASGCAPLRTRGCPGPCIAAPLPVRFIAGLLVVA